MTTLQFNTGRKYTIHGQRITATLHADGVVTFYDHDRMVDGEFKLGIHCQFNSTEVMHWYDSNMAQGTRRSREDMHRGGCNATFTTSKRA
jgi:hypothetical protein